MRIAILSDSLGRPRPNLDNENKTRYSDVYGYKLKTHFSKQHDVELCYVESLDSEDAVFWSQRMIAFREPDVVVYHMGINDCFPRLFKKNSKNIILNSIFRKSTFDIFLKILHRYRLQITKYFRKTYVTEEKFKLNFEKMCKEVKTYSPNAVFFGVTICYAVGNNLRRNFNINANIKRYNAILSDVFKGNIVDINTLLPNENLLINDEIHLTKKAHEALANELVTIIEQIIKET